MKIKRIIQEISKIFSIVKSIYINFKYLPFEYAKHLPLLVHWSTKMFIKDSKILFDTIPHRFIFQFGVESSPDVPENKVTRITLVQSTLSFSGKYPVKIRRGSTISGTQSVIQIGGNVFINSNLYLKTSKKIVIGNDVMLGYNVSLRDSDGHSFNESKKSSDKISINDNVWIGAKADILKGTELKSGVVVGYRSLVTSSINNKHSKKSLIAGIPSKVIKENVKWSGLEDFFGEGYMRIGDYDEEL
jgi:acetyltransferase-like isoleucine patch superfamily enzyme